MENSIRVTLEGDAGILDQGVFDDLIEARQKITDWVFSMEPGDIIKMLEVE